jgi:hypothetical protein
LGSKSKADSGAPIESDLSLDTVICYARQSEPVILQ